MGHGANSWAHNYRLARTLFVLTVLMVVLGYMALRDTHEVVEREKTVGTIVKMHDEIGLVELPGGDRTRLWLHPAAEAGDRVPLVRDLYDDGSVRYQVDRRRWQRGAAQR